MQRSQISRRPIHNALLPQGIVFVVILAFVTVCAVLRNVNLLVVVSGTMSAVLLICWRLSRKMLRNTVVQRLMPEEIHAGETIPIQWQVDNCGRSSIFNLRIEDRIARVEADPASLGDPAEASLFAKSGPQASAAIGMVLVEGILPNDNLVASYRAMFANRGIYTAGPAIVSAQFPLPLIRNWFRSNQISQIHVAPAIGELLPGWQERLAQDANRFESHSSRSGNNEDDFFAIRNWQSGDSLRHIHWRSTAKVGQPMVRQFESYAPQTLAVAVDLYADPGNISNSLDQESASQICEEILRLVATLLHQWRQNRSQKLLVGVADETATWHAADRDSQFAVHLHQRLATASACRDTAILELLNTWNTNISGGSDLLILSSRPMPPEIQEYTQLKNVNWLHCTNEQLQHLFQQSKRGELQKDAI